MDALSIHRTFVIRLYADDDFTPEHVSGQAEHVLSGEGGEFHSVDELLRLMERVLSARRPWRRDVINKENRSTE